MSKSQNLTQSENLRQGLFRASFQGFPLHQNMTVGNASDPRHAEGIAHYTPEGVCGSRLRQERGNSPNC